MKKKNPWTLFIGVVFMLAMVVTSNVIAADYAHELVDQKITFSWTVNGDNLAVKLAAETDGWVGIGFNPTEQMAGANFILGYVKNGEAQVIDDFGYDENRHKSDTKLDGTTDVTLVSGTEAGGITTIEFTLPLDSGDKNDSKIDVNGDTKILLAYGAGRDSFLSKHKYRSTHTVNLTTGVFKKIEN